MKPGDLEGRHDEGRYEITAMVEAFAREAGDVDALVWVLGRDLSYSCGFLQVAEAYRGTL